VIKASHPSELSIIRYRYRITHRIQRGQIRETDIIMAYRFTAKANVMVTALYNIILPAASLSLCSSHAFCWCALVKNSIPHTQNKNITSSPVAIQRNEESAFKKSAERVRNFTRARCTAELVCFILMRGNETFEMLRLCMYLCSVE
jgi:hypothetical protein